MERRSEAGVIAGVAVAGALVLALQVGVAYQVAVERRGADGASWAWLVTFVGLPLVAFGGAIAAPHRVRAVAVAALAADLAVFLVFKGMTVIRLGSVGRQILIGQVALAALTVVAARAGSRRRSAPDQADLVSR